MAELDIALAMSRYEPLPPARRASALALVGLSVSVLAHGFVLFALIHNKPARTGDSGAQEIPVEIVVAASRPEPANLRNPPARQPGPAKVEPPAVSTTATAKNQPALAPSQILAAKPPSPPATQDAPSGPEPPPPSMDPVRLADAAAKSDAPAPHSSVQALSPPPQPIKVSRTDRWRSKKHSEQDAERHRREELRERRREKAEIQRKKEAAARKLAKAKKREQTRAEAQAAKAQDRSAAEKRFARTQALFRLGAAARAGRLDYRSAVLSRLAAFKHYPESARARGAQGRTVVSFTLDEEGRVVSARIVRSSGQADIDAATLAMVRRAEPFPAPPRGAPRSFSAAIQFHLE